MKTRSRWLDIAKGISIMLMVVGHTSIPDYLSHFIYSFHMPLFFIASGLTSNFDKYDLGQYIKHKILSLMLPFLIYSSLVMFLLWSLNSLNFISLVKNGWGGYALWFVPVMFFALVLVRLYWWIASFLSHPTQRKIARYLMMLGLLIVAYLMRYYEWFLPWNLSTVPYAAFLIMVGQCFSDFKSQIVTANRLLDFVILTIVTITISRFWHLDLAWNQILPIIPLTLGAVSGTLMIFKISVWIEHKTNVVSEVLQSIGKETFIILSFSQIIIMCINHVCNINPILKYLILIVLLILLKYAKDYINKLVKFKIL